jgi:elongation factor P
MSMLEYNEITARKYIVVDGAPYEVIENHIARTQQRKPQNQTKVRNLLTGRLSNMTFHAADKVEQAEIESKEVKYLYTTKDEFWFCEANDPSKRFKISEEILGVKSKFLKPNSVYDAELFDEKIFGVKLDATVDLKVVEAPPGVKGDTARGGNKLVKVETGAMVTAPLFVNEGDIIRINTETGEYRERVMK